MNRRYMALPIRGITRRSMSRRNNDDLLLVLRERGTVQHPLTLHPQEQAGGWEARLATADIIQNQAQPPSQQAQYHRVQ